MLALALPDARSPTAGRRPVVRNRADECCGSPHTRCHARHTTCESLIRQKAIRASLWRRRRRAVQVPSRQEENPRSECSARKPEKQTRGPWKHPRRSSAEDGHVPGQDGGNRTTEGRRRADQDGSPPQGGPAQTVDLGARSCRTCGTLPFPGSCPPTTTPAGCGTSTPSPCPPTPTTSR